MNCSSGAVKVAGASTSAVNPTFITGFGRKASPIWAAEATGVPKWPGSFRSARSQVLRKPRRWAGRPKTSETGTGQVTPAPSASPQARRRAGEGGLDTRNHIDGPTVWS
jgi:hypothetical protein